MSKQKKKKKKSAKTRKHPKMPDRKLQVTYVPVGKLKLWGKNPRHNDDAVDQLAELIRTHGFCSPVVCTRDNVVRVGNTRLKAARKIDMKTIPVVYVDFPTERQAELYAIADNRSSEWSAWNEDALAKLLRKRKEIPDAEIERMTGFEKQEIEGIRKGWKPPETKTGDTGKSKEAVVIRCPYCSEEFSLDE